ncbi:DUF4625 domain-containing protein [Sinomicrobium soli]|uniref:DUF4625 domain-containing protein n=1 Tax=Sinomicrobium sp. N-1-3-6 TaxID=2219864 RepID=UPI000DCC5818|nr:DUF4625 domain-containing protein [Sinomicrobium sp. N-1-3-6]RAV28215.1 hypothetical protein DN748_14690 [Sinomicrobium sp. N-1-3-6]
MKLKKRYLPVLLMLGLLGCSDDDSIDKDEEKPTISIAYDEGFPKACEVLKRGETYTFRARVTDNMALAAYSLDIHHNFDHHTHDDQEETCELGPVKEASDPWTLMENYTIEEGGTSYEIQLELTVPEDVDTGDYHCQYSVIDATGWQSRTAIDIKVVE